jgi:drug/metabolite transporter (DMT)-like permease
MNSFVTARVIGFFALGLVIAGNAAGNIFLKLGAGAPPEKALFGLLSWQTIVGIACFAFGILAYAWALKHIELHVAQIAVSLQYVAVIGLAAVLLGEQVTMNQWVGIALIALGLFVSSR